MNNTLKSKHIKFIHERTLEIIHSDPSIKTHIAMKMANEEWKNNTSKN